MSFLTYEIPLANLTHLEERLSELNRRAKRLRIRESQISVVGVPFTKTINRFPHLLEGKVDVSFITVSMTGGEPVTLDGWDFVATLHHEDAGATLVAMVPGEELPVAYRWATNDCDHCHTSRRRNSTFVVRNPDGELKQVGSGCLADYLPRSGRDPKVLAKYAEWLGAWSVAVGELSDDERHEVKARGEQTWSLESWLSMTALIVRNCGWVSKGKARNNHDLIATADSVMNFIDPWNDDLKKWAKEIGPVTTADSETAQAAIEWAEEALLDDSPDLSDYLHNLSVVVRLGYVRQKHLGLAASLLVAHQFATRKAAAETKRAEEGKASCHLATVKDRVRLHGVKVVFTKVMPDRGWGESLLVKLVDRSGNRMVWFCSGSGPDLEAGWVIDLKGTVKAHSEFQNVKETTLTRVVWCFAEGQEDVLHGHVAVYAEGVGKGKVALDDGREEAA